MSENELIERLRKAAELIDGLEVGRDCVAQKTKTWWGDEKRKIRVPDALLAERSKGEGND